MSAMMPDSAPVTVAQALRIVIRDKRKAFTIDREWLLLTLAEAGDDGHAAVTEALLRRYLGTDF